MIKTKGQILPLLSSTFLCVTYLLLVFPLGGEPGLNTLPGLHKGLPLCHLARVMRQYSSQVGCHEQHDIRYQLKRKENETWSHYWYWCLLYVKTSKTWFYKLPAARFSPINLIFLIKRFENSKKISENLQKCPRKNSKIFEKWGKILIVKKFWIVKNLNG